MRTAMGLAQMTVVQMVEHLESWTAENSELVRAVQLAGSWVQMKVDA